MKIKRRLPDLWVPYNLIGLYVELTDTGGVEHDGHIILTAEPIKGNMSFGFPVGQTPDTDTVVAGDKWLAPFDEDGDQSYAGWDFGSLDNDCTMDVNAATGKSWIALFS